jgi:hypothetical protein
MSAPQVYQELSLITTAIFALVEIGMYAKTVGSVELLALKRLTFW